MGTFYLNGYTREQPVAESDDPIFLKTVGDRVTLWFNLKEDIAGLHEKDNLSINLDEMLNRDYDAFLIELANNIELFMVILDKVFNPDVGIAFKNYNLYRVIDSQSSGNPINSYNRCWSIRLVFFK